MNPDPWADDIFRFFVVVTAVFIGMVALFVFLFISFSKKQTRSMEELNRLNFEHEKALLNTKLEIQELTFQSISREIHDHVNHWLLLSKGHLDNVDFSNEEAAKAKISSASGLIKETLTSLGQISRNLDSDRIKKIGLADTLQMEINRLNASGLFSVKKQLSGYGKSMDPDKELLISRIAQEVLSNIIKHSKAKNVELSLNYHDDHLDLIISDDGVGFNYQPDAKSSHGSGLDNIKARVKMLNGVINIKSGPDEGTSVSISIPYNHPAIQ